MSAPKLHILEVPEHTCPQCGHLLDRAMLSDPTVTPPRLPAPGDLSICGGCFGVNVFTGEGLMPATTDEQAALPPWIARFLTTTRRTP